jgi:hypothetical protein
MFDLPTRCALLTRGKRHSLLFNVLTSKNNMNKEYFKIKMSYILNKEAIRNSNNVDKNATATSFTLI